MKNLEIDEPTVRAFVIQKFGSMSEIRIENFVKTFEQLAEQRSFNDLMGIDIIFEYVQFYNLMHEK